MSLFSRVVVFSLIICRSTAETKGRTYAELDILFENRVSARKFSKTRVDNLTEGTEAAQKEQAAHIIRDEKSREIAEV